MNFDKDRLYNPEVKLHFLEELDGVEGGVKLFYNTLAETAVTERRLNKDLYEMHEQEIEEVLHELGKRSARSVMVSFSRIKRYIEWSGRIYSNRKFPLFAGVTFAQIAYKYVATSVLSFYKQDELFELYEEMDSPYDIITIQAMFEGIKGRKYSELFNLKAEDRFTENNKRFVYLYDTEDGTERHLEISEFLYNLIEEADKVTSYTEFDTGKTIILNQESPYVLKKSSRGKASATGLDVRVSDQFIYKKIKMYREIFNSPTFKIGDIQSSGLMYYLYEMIKDQEEDVKVISFETLKTVGDRFGIKQYLQSEALKQYTPYALIRDRIDEEYFKENYTDFIYATSTK